MLHVTGILHAEHLAYSDDKSALVLSFNFPNSTIEELSDKIKLPL